TPGSSGGSPKRSKLASHGACCEVEPAVPARSPALALTLGSLTRRRQLLGWWYNRRGSSFHKFERVNGVPEAEPLAQAWSIESVRKRVGSGLQREVPEAESLRSRPRECVCSARVGMRANARHPRPRVSARGRGSASVRHARWGARQREVPEAESLRSRPRQCVCSPRALGCAPTRGTRGGESTLEAEAVRLFATRVGGGTPTRGTRGRESTLEAEAVRQFGRRVGGGAPTRGNKRRGIMGRLGLPELLVILAIVIIIFGANRLPEIGRGIGSAIRNFKNETKDEKP